MSFPYLRVVRLADGRELVPAPPSRLIPLGPQGQPLLFYEHAASGLRVSLSCDPPAPGSLVSHMHIAVSPLAAPGARLTMADAMLVRQAFFPADIDVQVARHGLFVHLDGAVPAATLVPVRAIGLSPFPRLPRRVS